MMMRNITSMMLIGLVIWTSVFIVATTVAFEMDGDQSNASNIMRMVQRDVSCIRDTASLSNRSDLVRSAIEVYISTNDSLDNFQLLTSLTMLNDTELDSDAEEQVERVLLDTYIGDSPVYFQRRALLAMQSRKAFSDNSKNEILILAKSGDVGALMVATKQSWIDASLVNHLQMQLEDNSKDGRMKTATFYPSRCFSQQRRAELRGVLSFSIDIADKDVARAYLARSGDTDSLRLLERLYEMAQQSKSTPSVKNNKSKLYWYTVLLLSGHPPSEIPHMPDPEL